MDNGLAAAAKMNGLGNAVLILDMRGRDEPLAAEFVRALAQNPQSAFDQMMVLRDAPEAEAAKAGGAVWRAEIRNADGSKAQACGNGIRCLAAFLRRRGEGGADGLRFITDGGTVLARQEEDGRITADMGRARFAAGAVPLRFVPEDPLRAPLRQLLPAGAAAAFRAFPQQAALVSVGNPHAVFFIHDKTADLAAFPLAEFGAALETSPVFPEGVNVSLAQIVSPAALRLRVWERGAGLTQACGTAACAAQAAAHRLGLTRAAAEIALPGGLLAARIENGRCLQTGPAEYEYGGAVNLRRALFVKAG